VGKQVDPETRAKAVEQWLERFRAAMEIAYGRHDKDAWREASANYREARAREDVHV
jgi:hypothetical protein